MNCETEEVEIDGHINAVESTIQPGTTTTLKSKESKVTTITDDSVTESLHSSKSSDELKKDLPTTEERIANEQSSNSEVRNFSEQKNEDDNDQKSSSLTSSSPITCSDERSTNSQKSSDSNSLEKDGTKKLRKGKWTPEEEEYANAVTRYFRSGLLELPNGHTLRSYLAYKLNCDPMRITKKFASQGCLGKRVFNCGKSFIPEEHIQLARQELDRLEKNYQYRVEYGRSPLHTQTNQSSFDPYNPFIQQTNPPILSPHNPSVIVPTRDPTPPFGEQVLSMDTATSPSLTDQNDLSRFLFQGLMQTQMNPTIQPYVSQPQQLQNQNPLLLQLAQLSQSFGNGNVTSMIQQQQIPQSNMTFQSTHLLNSLLNSQQTQNK
jgi:hypothetical protein